MYKKLLTIQDISCVGQCSMTVALPILSACGHETCILPSAVLSTHTSGFTGFTVRDLTDDFPAIRDHWQREGIKFDAIYTGYLGSVLHCKYVAEMADTLMVNGGLLVVDPAMADNGKLYPAFDDVYVKAMAGLCARADIILPNITEACMLVGYPYQENYDENYVAGLLTKLHELCRGTVVLTGVSYTADSTGVLVSYADGHKTYYKHRRVSPSYHGTGDIYSSAFVGALMSGKEMDDAAAIAADYTVRCIENTINDEKHWYGTKFETALPYLIERLGK